MLWLRVKRNSYHTVYQPNMQVYHMQGSATGKLVEKNRWVHENLAIGAEIYIETVKQYKKDMSVN